MGLLPSNRGARLKSRVTNGFEATYVACALSKDWDTRSAAIDSLLGDGLPAQRSAAQGITCTTIVVPRSRSALNRC